MKSALNRCEMILEKKGLAAIRNVVGVFLQFSDGSETLSERESGLQRTGSNAEKQVAHPECWSRVVDFDPPDD